MAPKAAKRSAATAPVSRPKKVAKATPQDDQLQAVTQAVESMVDLPDSCRFMLLALLPGSLGTPNDSRHPVQDHAVTMIGEALDKTKAGKEAGLAQATKDKAAADGKLAELQAAQTAAESSLEAKRQAAQEKLGERDAAQGLLAQAKEALAARQQEEKAAQDAQTAKKEESSSFDAAIADHFAPLKEGAWDEGAAAGKQHLEALGPALEKAALDGSVMASLNIVGAKRAGERTNFDGMVLEQVGASMAEKSASLKKELEERGPAVAERGAAVAAQASEVEKAESELSNRRSALEQAQAQQNESETACKSACQEFKTFSTEAKKTAKAAEAAQAELELFAGGPLAAFEALRSATSKSAEAATEAVTATEENAAPVTAGGA